MTKFTQEIVFPFSPAVHGLFFFDAGNTWNSFQDANLLSVKRGLGLGISLFLGFSLMILFFIKSDYFSSDITISPYLLWDWSEK